MTFKSTKTWYATVGFGGNPAPKGPWDDPEKAAAAIRRWLDREGYRVSNRVMAHTIRVHAYQTREQARYADVSDAPGADNDGAYCISITGLYDFLANHPEEDDPPPIPFVPADPTTCTCVDPFSNCPTHG
jgi:hypothetical protein